MREPLVSHSLSDIGRTLSTMTHPRSSTCQASYVLHALDLRCLPSLQCNQQRVAVVICLDAHMLSKSDSSIRPEQMVASPSPV